MERKYEKYDCQKQKMDIIRQENVIKNNAKRNMKIIKDNIGNLNLSEKNNWYEKMNLGRFRKRSKQTTTMTTD